MDFTNCTEKKKEKVFTQTGWIWAATVRTERRIAIGPAQGLVCASGRVDDEGSFTAGLAKAVST